MWDSHCCRLPSLPFLHGGRTASPTSAIDKLQARAFKRHSSTPTARHCHRTAHTRRATTSSRCAAPALPPAGTTAPPTFLPAPLPQTLPCLRALATRSSPLWAVNARATPQTPSSPPTTNHISYRTTTSSDACGAGLGKGRGYLCHFHAMARLPLHYALKYFHGTTCGLGLQLPRTPHTQEHCMPGRWLGHNIPFTGDTVENI